MPIGYVSLDIHVQGPQFREIVAANLAAFTSASARGRRNLESIVRPRMACYSGLKSLPEE
jgi:hypothetical protein